jgi:hypothetical protein
VHCANVRIGVLCVRIVAGICYDSNGLLLLSKDPIYVRL